LAEQPEKRAQCKDSDVVEAIFYLFALQIALNLKVFGGTEETEQEAQASNEHRLGRIHFLILILIKSN